MKHPLIEYSGLSDIGVSRDNNEDYYLTSVENQLYIIADGIGGCKAGEVAAQEAAFFVSNYAGKYLPFHRKKRALKRTIIRSFSTLTKKANTHVYLLSKTSSEGVSPNFFFIPFLTKKSKYS